MPLSTNFAKLKMWSAISLAILLWISLFIFIFFIKENGPDKVLIAVLFIFGIFGYLLATNISKGQKQIERIESLAKELREAHEKLKELDKKKSEFLSMASHQFRGPLTSIKGYTSMLLEGEYGKLSQKEKDTLEKIFSSTQTLVYMVEDFMNATKLEEGRMEYKFDKFDIAKLLYDIYKESKGTADTLGVQLEIDLHGENSLIVNGDEIKMRHVMINLIDNALKYSPKGNVKISMENEDNNLIVRVIDNGIGISREFKPQLFDKFTRAKEANQVNVNGTGLGLYVAKQIVEAHQGKIWAESEGTGKGSTFIVNIPINPAIKL